MAICSTEIFHLLENCLGFQIVELTSLVQRKLIFATLSPQHSRCIKPAGMETLITVKVFGVVFVFRLLFILGFFDIVMFCLVLFSFV